MSNYDEARKLLNDGYSNDNDVLRANGIATLALVDEMRAARQPESSEIFTVCVYRPDKDSVGQPLEAFKDRTEAFDRRDELNNSATAHGVDERYVVKVLEVR